MKENREDEERAPASADEPAASDPLLEEQEKKGYGEDEGEREEALPRE